MTEIENKKRKTSGDEETVAVAAVKDNWFEELQKREEELQAPESAWLRAYVTPFIFDSPSLTMYGKMNWPKFWHPLRVPQNEAELPKFLARVAKMHEDRHYGSFELQILLHALSVRERGYLLASKINEELHEAKVGSKLTQQIQRALTKYDRFVDFTPLDKECCKECNQPRFSLSLRFFSFTNEYK